MKRQIKTFLRNKLQQQQQQQKHLTSLGMQLVNLPCQ